MPRKSKRPCRYKGCPALTESESGYCTEHEKIMTREWQRKLRESYVRPEGYNKRYGRQWRKIRNAFINLNPLCEMCKRQGRYTLAQEIHHITPISKGGKNEFENLMALCKSCHSKITFEENYRKEKKK